MTQQCRAWSSGAQFAFLVRSCEAGAGRLGQRHGLIIKGKRISSPPQYGHRDLQGVPRRLGERHGFEHGFPLTRSLRASAQRSTSVLFSFVLSFDCGRIIYHPAIKNDSSAILVILFRRVTTL